MKLTVPIIAVLGRKKSGKTTLITWLASSLRKKGLRILTAKHIAHSNFTIDSPGKDTHVLRKSAGAVFYFADSGELGVILDNMSTRDMLELLCRVAELFKINIVIMEGFSNIVANIPEIAKIICIKDESDIEYYLSLNMDGPILICSYFNLSNVSNVVKLPSDEKILLSFVEKYVSIHEIYSKLGGLNCGKCGYGRCINLARAIYLRRETYVRCVHYTSSGVKLKVNGRVIPLNKFVSDLLKNIVKAFVSSLKGVPDRLNSIAIEIELTSSDDSSGS